MKQILYIIYYVLIVFSFITAFSFALATVLWLVGILGISAWAVAKTFLVLAINVVSIILTENRINKYE